METLKRARALYDFPNPPPGDFLGLKKGDVLVIEATGQKWWWGTFEKDSSLSGWVPPNYLEILGDAKPLGPPTTPRAPTTLNSPRKSLKTAVGGEGENEPFVVEAKYKLETSQGPTYLTFEKGERFIISKGKKEWWWATRPSDLSKSGWVPAAYVQKAEEATEKECAAISTLKQQKKTAEAASASGNDSVGKQGQQLERQDSSVDAKKEPEAKVSILAEAKYALAVSQGANYLTFNKGDEFIIINQDKRDWWWGSLRTNPTKKGWVPLSYLVSKGPYEPPRKQTTEQHLETSDMDDIDPSTPKAEARYNLKSDKGGLYLSFKKGEVFYITRQDKKDWWWAVDPDDHSRKGWVPSNYVALKAQDTVEEVPKQQDSAEELRLKLQQEKLKLEAERLKLEQERIRQEHEELKRQKEEREAELRRKEEERLKQQQEEEARKAAALKLLEEERAKLEEQKRKLEEERARFEDSKKRHEEDMSKKHADAMKLPEQQQKSRLKELEEEQKQWENSHGASGAGETAKFKAKKDYTGSAGQLSFVKGDIIVRTAASSEAWWTGYLERDESIKGLFPSTYVSEITKEEVGKVKWDYKGKDANYLTIKKGEVVTVTARKREWWFAVSQADPQVKGWIPGAYIQLLAAPTAQVPDPGAAGAAQPKPAASPAIQSPPGSPLASPKAAKPVFVKVKQTFEAKDPSHLPLVLGETVVLLQKGTGSKEGWWEGSNGVQTGWFPATAVEEPEERPKEEVYEAHHPYTPSKEGPYLALALGARVVVSRKKGEWLYGRMVNDPASKGWFPASFVSLVPPDLPPVLDEALGPGDS